MNEESRLQLERYLQLVNRRKWVLIIPVVLAVLGAALLSYLQEPVYEATAIVRVDQRRYRRRRRRLRCR